LLKTQGRVCRVRAQLVCHQKWLGHLLMPLLLSLLVGAGARAALVHPLSKSGKLLATLSLLIIALMGTRPVSYELARSLEQTYPPSR
jgi:hypothetical protein